MRYAAACAEGASAATNSAGDGHGCRLEGNARRSRDRSHRPRLKAREHPAGDPALAPTFAVIALLAVGAKGDPTGFKDACLAGAKTIPAYLVFLAACYLLIDRVDYRLAIVGGLGAWLAAALAVFLAPRLL